MGDRMEFHKEAREFESAAKIVSLTDLSRVDPDYCREMSRLFGQLYSR